MADDPTAEVTIYHPATDPEKVATRTVAAIAVGGFTNSGWVVLDAAGRKKAQQPTTGTES